MPKSSLVPRPQNYMSHTDPSARNFGDRHDMDETFEISKFTATFKACRRFGRNNTIIMKGDKPKVFDVPRTKKNGLDPASHPEELVRISLITDEINLNQKIRCLETENAC